MKNIEKLPSVELNHLLGKHFLSGCSFGSYEWNDKYYGDKSNTMTFIIDGQPITAIEDRNDGYRSSMDRLVVGGECDNKFSAIQVVGKWKEDESWNNNKTIQLIDVENGNIIIEVGTDNYDDWYPMFVNKFNPDEMYINEEN